MPSGVEGEKPEIISKLLPDETAAFWEGYRVMEPKIDAEYDEYKKALLKKAKRKKRV